MTELNIKIELSISPALMELFAGAIAKVALAQPQVPALAPAPIRIPEQILMPVPVNADSLLAPAPMLIPEVKKNLLTELRGFISLATAKGNKDKLIAILTEMGYPSVSSLPAAMHQECYDKFKPLTI